MSYYSDCLMFKNLDANIRVDNDAVFITISDEKDNGVSITLNPFQLLILNKYLFAVLDSITLQDILNYKILGSLNAKIENENIIADNFKIPSGCYDQEFVYPNDEELISAAS